MPSGNEDQGSSANSGVAEDGAAPLKKKKYSRKSRKGGYGSKEAKEARSHRKLEERAAEKGREIYVAEGGLQAEKLPISQPGWMGLQFPDDSGKRIIDAWVSGEIIQALKEFQLIPFDDNSSPPSLSEQRPTEVKDQLHRTLFARSAKMSCMEVSDDLLALYDKACEEFVACWEKIPRADIEGNSRGDHLFCISGYHRNLKNLSKPPPRTFIAALGNGLSRLRLSLATVSGSWRPEIRVNTLCVEDFFAASGNQFPHL
ncbi:hypothetical protein DENSPDRAFT_875860 [Dentipellis sp. KUC8613]|nr:hypothetical protein DENSPDRAFT_875860 [Dentipellis sp. KUC8613]